MTTLTEQQQHTLYLMRQRGMWLTAAATAESWQRGERYYLDVRVQADSYLRGQFQQGNDTAVFGRLR